MKGLPFVLFFTAMTFVAWGAYGPVLHHGALALEHDSLRAFVGVGLAYFMIAVIIPILILQRAAEPGRWTILGAIYSLVAGAVGAVGALGIILALAYGGQTVYVMPLVFGFAPVVNTLVTAMLSRTFNQIRPIFLFGILTAALGAGGVLAFKPSPKPAAKPADATAEISKPEEASTKPATKDGSAEQSTAPTEPAESAADEKSVDASPEVPADNQPEQTSEPIEETTESPPSEVPSSEVPSSEVPSSEVTSSETPLSETPQSETPASTGEPAVEEVDAEAPPRPSRPAESASPNSEDQTGPAASENPADASQSVVTAENPGARASIPRGRFVKLEGTAQAASSTATAAPATARQLNVPGVIVSIIMAALCWGSYGPMLHIGQGKMSGSRLRPFICVGLAYFFIAVAAPLFLIYSRAEDTGAWTASGMTWSILAGCAGAIGALGVILAFNAGGKPYYVMPLVFGFAPVINTFISLTESGTWGQVSIYFWISLGVVITGAVIVLTNAPKPKPHAAPAK